VEAISDLPMLHDIDADYSPQYVKLARIIRDKIESGEYERLDALPAAGVAGAYGVSIGVAYAALAMLGANRYVSRVRGLRSYRVTWDATSNGSHTQGSRHREIFYAGLGWGLTS
jgi:DNA-binding transcriptional MocR family regulator